MSPEGTKSVLIENHGFFFFAFSSMFSQNIPLQKITKKERKKNAGCLFKDWELFNQEVEITG